jgi:hypothetical protein
MAFNRAQKKKMKMFLIIGGVCVVLYYLVFKTTGGKAVVNGLAVKAGLGTVAKPWIA